MLLVLADLQFLHGENCGSNDTTVTRAFSPYLTFWYFRGKAKKYEEYMHDRESGKFPLREFACSVFYRLLVPKGGAKKHPTG